MVKPKRKQPKEKEAALIEIDQIGELIDAMSRKRLNTEWQVGLQRHLSKSFVIQNHFHYIKNHRQAYEAFRQTFLNIDHKWNQRSKALAKPNQLTYLDRVIWTAQVFLVNAFEMRYVSSFLGVQVDSESIVQSVMIYQAMYGGQTSPLNKDFTKNEIFELEQEFWEIYRTQGLFFIVDITILDGKRGGQKIACLVVMTAKCKIRWAEEIYVTDDETDEDILRKSLFKDQLKLIKDFQLGIKCRLGHTHIIQLHGYADSKMDMSNKIYLDFDGVLHTPYYKKNVNSEADLSQAKLSCNIVRNLIRGLIEIKPIRVIKTSEWAKHNFVYNTWSKEFHKECFKTLYLRYNSFPFEPPSFVPLTKDKRKATRSKRDPSIDTRDLRDCLYLEDKTKPVQRISKIYVPKTDNLMPCEMVPEVRSLYRERQTVPATLAVTKEEKEEIIAEVEDLVSKYKDWRREQGRPCAEDELS